MATLTHKDTSLRRTSGAFTLVEVVIALALMGLVISVAYGALTSIMRSKQVLDTERGAQAIADAILVRLAREVQMASAEESLLPPPNAVPAAAGGSVGTKPMSMEGLGASMPNGARADSITFLANDGGQYLPDGSGHSGIVQITYRVAEDPEGQDREPRRYYLIREEVPYILPADSAYERRMVFPITRDLVELRFRYFSRKNNRWEDEWGQLPDEDKLPAVVEFTVGILSATGKLLRISSAVPIAKE